MSVGRGPPSLKIPRRQTKGTRVSECPILESSKERKWKGINETVVDGKETRSWLLL